MVSRQDLKGTMTYPKEESSCLETGWDRLELPEAVISQPLVK